MRGLALVAALGGLLFGCDTAVISGAVGAIDANFVAPRGLSGWAIACALLGCVIGAALAGPMSQKIGCKGGLLVSAVLFMFSSVGSAYPEFGFLWIDGDGPQALTAFILYRILGGIGIGVASMLSPLYIAEMAAPRQRRQLVTYQQVAIVVGMTLVYIVNRYIALAALFVWHFVPETKGHSLEAIQHLWTKQPAELLDTSATANA